MRCCAQVVQVTVGDGGQTLELHLAVDLELALEDMLGRGSAQPLMRPVHAGQQRYILDPVAKRKTELPRGLDKHSARSCKRRSAAYTAPGSDPSSVPYTHE